MPRHRRVLKFLNTRRGSYFFRLMATVAAARANCGGPS